MYFLILIVLLSTWKSQVFGSVILKGNEENETCESEECYKTAHHILKWLNPEVNPCEDFYDFVCGNWKNLPEYEREKYSIGSRGDIVESSLPDILEQTSTAVGSRYFELLRNFMIACMDKDTIHSLGVTPIQQLIKKSGGWPVLDADWSGEAWDFLEAEITLGGVLIDVSSASVWDYKTSSARSRIRVGKSKLIKSFTPDIKELRQGLKNGKTKAYYKRMVDMAVLLGADEGVAKEDMKESLKFETAFIKELLNLRKAEKFTTFKDIQERVSWLNVSQLLDVYLPDSFELLPQQKIIFGEELFLALENCISQYPPRTFANYLISKAVYPLLDYVDNSRSYGYKKLSNKQAFRFYYCTNIVSSSSLGPAMVSYIAHLYMNATSSAAEMTAVIVKQLLKEVREINWLDEITRSDVAKNISVLKINVGFPDEIMDLGELEKLYKQYEVDGSSFFDFMVYDKKWIKQRDFIWLEKNYNEDRFNLGWRNWTLMGLANHAYFTPRLNVIDVSGPFLYFLPLFSPGNPAYVNYGHLGSIVAHELIHGVVLNHATTSNGEKVPPKHPEPKRWGSNETKNIFNQKIECFVDFYSSINDTKLTKLKLNGTQTLNEDLADNGGLRLSLRAYRKLAGQLSSPERKLPLLQQYSVEQLFMISAANAYCEIPYKEERIKQIATDNHSVFEFRVNGMMMNSPDFSEIFNCDKSDPMNPPDKCEVW